MVLAIDKSKILLLLKGGAQRAIVLGYGLFVLDKLNTLIRDL